MFNAALRGFSAIMVLVYIGAGVFIILAKDRFENMTPYLRISLGSLIIIYGLFRLYSAYRKYKDEREEEFEEENGE